MEENRVVKLITQSISQLIWCPGNRSFHFGVRNLCHARETWPINQLSADKDRNFAD